jgi:hypothetical protein
VAKQEREVLDALELPEVQEVLAAAYHKLSPAQQRAVERTGDQYEELVDRMFEADDAGDQQTVWKIEERLLGVSTRLVRQHRLPATETKRILALM